ncbi:MAG: hypothetical protein N2Z21_00935, partial [Candidatus Sumerlaeaceae bacterium]|nr:hypothetical protein [Candidatus Sumerlaeaceae bacterium]
MLSVDTPVVVIGKPRSSLLEGLIPPRIGRQELEGMPPGNVQSSCVVAQATFDYYDYLRFGQELVRLRDAVAVGGDLILVRPRRGTHDEFFVYRDDEFFVSEFPSIWEADFCHASVRGDDHKLWIHLSQRRSPEKADEIRRRLPWRHLAHVFTFA